MGSSSQDLDLRPEMTLLTSSWDIGMNPFSSGATKSSGEYTGLLLSNSLILSILPWKCEAKDSASSSLLVCVGQSCSTCLVVRLLTSLCSFHESLVHSWILSCRVVLFFALSKPKYEFLTFLKATHRESSLYLSHFSHTYTPSSLEPSSLGHTKVAWL